MELVWSEVKLTSDGDLAWHAKLSATEHLSVVDRMTGFGHRDIETGFRRWIIDETNTGKTTSEFFLATSYDIRDHIKPEHTVADFERMVKEAGSWWTA